MPSKSPFDLNLFQLSSSVNIQDTWEYSYQIWSMKNLKIKSRRIFAIYTANYVCMYDFEQWKFRSIPLSSFEQLLEQTDRQTDKKAETINYI